MLKIRFDEQEYEKKFRPATEIIGAAFVSGGSIIKKCICSTVQFIRKISTENVESSNNNFEHKKAEDKSQPK